MAQDNNKKKTPEEIAAELEMKRKAARQESENDAWERYKNNAPSAPEYTPVDVTAPNKPVSNYDYYTNLTNSFLKLPMTPEEEEKRAKSAYAIQGVGALGNVLNAFSNLYFTGKGAPSQKLPELPDADAKVKEMRDRAAKERENYLRAKAYARLQDRNEWAQDQQMYGQQVDRANALKGKQYAESADLFNKGLNYATQQGNQASSDVYQNQQVGQNQYNADWQRNFQEKRAAQQDYQWAETRKDNKEYHDAQMRNAEIKNTADLLKAQHEAESNGDVSRPTEFLIMGKDGNPMSVTTRVNWKAMADIEAQLLHDEAMPKEILQKFDRGSYNRKGDVQKEAEARHQALLEAIKTNPYFSEKVYKAFENAGGIAGEEGAKARWVANDKRQSKEKKTDGSAEWEQ